MVAYASRSLILRIRSGAIGIMRTLLCVVCGSWMVGMKSGANGMLAGAGIITGAGSDSLNCFTFEYFIFCSLGTS